MLSRNGASSTRQMTKSLRLVLWRRSLELQSEISLTRSLFYTHRSTTLGRLDTGYAEPRSVANPSLKSSGPLALQQASFQNMQIRSKTVFPEKLASQTTVSLSSYPSCTLPFSLQSKSLCRCNLTASIFTSHCSLNLVFGITFCVQTLLYFLRCPCEWISVVRS